MVIRDSLPPLDLSLDLRRGFLTIIARHTSHWREHRRSQLILEMTHMNPTQAALLMKCTRRTAYRWYYRTKELIESFSKVGISLAPHKIEAYIREFLKDEQRLGAPLKYTPEQQCAIIALAVRNPEEFDV